MIDRSCICCIKNGTLDIIHEFVLLINIAIKTNILTTCRYSRETKSIVVIMKSKNKKYLAMHMNDGNMCKNIYHIKNNSSVDEVKLSDMIADMIIDK